jgi:protease IV
LVTLFGEYILQRMPQVHNNVWSAGAVVEPISGLRIIGRYFDHGALNIGMQVNLGNIGFESQGHFDENQSHSYNTYAVRIGAYDGSLAELFTSKKSKYIGLNFGGKINYQRYEFFDNTKTLSIILSALDAAKNDPEVAGIAINTSGMEVNRELLWEIREKIKECKSAGKKVIIFIDRGNIDLYHFASVADEVVMDPLGTIMLEGYVMGRTYLKGSLEKLGIGFDEWRFFKYKSANESFSRDNMSDADREQRQELVDAWYSIAQKEICESRKMNTALFDSLVNNVIAISADDARTLGLVDSIGRWETVEEIVKSETKSDNGWKSLSSSQRKQALHHDEAWGEAPKIAVIYALGVCDMDQGISARTLVKDVDNAVNDKNVKAIVLRVDSPGGDALASDYIAEALKKAKGKKPVIISQGYVAASGGYWLSMYGDTIVAAPGTITGSIGVIGGWMYNKGMKEFLGMSTDYVKAGAHADLGFGMQMPILGLTMPDRNLTLEERSHVETMIRNMYKEFVVKVSNGRKLKEDSVAAIAQGRVWSGIDGKANGLVDELGGLETAITIAKERAGLPPSQYVKIVEIPQKGLFDLSMFMPKLFGFEAQIKANPTIEMLKFRIEQNGKPLPMIPFEDTDMLYHSGY